MVNQFKLRRQLQERKAMLRGADHKISETRRALKEIETRFNRELDMNPQLRQEESE